MLVPENPYDSDQGSGSAIKIQNPVYKEQTDLEIKKMDVLAGSLKQNQSKEKQNNGQIVQETWIPCKEKFDQEIDLLQNLCLETVKKMKACLIQPKKNDRATMSSKTKVMEHLENQKFVKRKMKVHKTDLQEMEQ